MDMPDRHAPAGLAPGDIAAALDWWREAGVDCDFADEPRRWLEPAAGPDGPGPEPLRLAPAEPAEPVAVAVPLGGDAALWPREHGAFIEWWLSEPALDDGQVRDRLAPRGRPGARLMILVPQPEAGDSEVLLAGPEGRLIAAFLGAAGIAEDDTYLAAALPRHTPLVDWSALAGRGAGALLAHHIALAAPERLIVLGTSILPLLGHDPTHNGDILRTFNHEGRSVPVLAAREPGALLARPAWKAAFWRNWLDWTGPTTA